MIDSTQELTVILSSNNVFRLQKFMEKDGRLGAFNTLKDIALKKGYVTFDDVIDVSDKNNLAINEVNTLSDSLLSQGILILDEAPDNNGELDETEYDYAQADYEQIYSRVLEKDNGLKILLDYIKSVKPAQKREFDQIKYQLFEGNPHVQKRVIDMHLRIAVRLGLQWSDNYDYDISDAISEAINGLLIAVEKYNPDENGAFASYSSFWIMQNLNRTLPNKRPLIYYPVHQKEGFIKVLSLLKDKGCYECDKRLACKKVISLIEEKTECSTKTAEEIILQYEEIESIDAIEEKNGDEIANIAVYQPYFSIEHVEQEVFEIILKESIDIVLGTLTERESDVIKRRYGLSGYSEMTLEEIGIRYGITRERIRQIEGKALRKLRHPSRNALLKDFVPE